MKLTPTPAPTIARDSITSAHSRRTEPAAPSAAIETAENAAAAKPMVPSGLERVLARLQSASPGSMNRGQANAMQHIEANIARFRDRHGIADAVTAPTAPAPTDTPTTATTDTTPAPTAMPADTSGTATTTDPTSTAATPDTSIDMSTTVADAPTATAITAPEPALLDAIPPSGSIIDTQV